MELYKLIPSIRDITLNEIQYGRLEPLSQLFFSLMKVFDNFYILQLIHALFINVVMFSFIKKSTNHIFLGVFLYFVIFYFYFNMEIIRESIAISFFLLSLNSYYKKKWIYYYLYIIVAILFHSSAIILVILPFFRLSKFNYKYALILLTIFIFSFFFRDIFINTLKLFYINERISGKIGLYETYTYSVYGFLSILFLYILLPIFIYFFSRKYKIESQYYNLLILYVFIGVATGYFYIFYRFINYLTPILLIFYVEVLSKVIFNRNKHSGSVKFATFCICLFFIIVINDARCFRKTYHSKDIRWYSHWYPYYSIFDEQKDEKRERIYNEQYGL